jgi:hypothetical protein
MISQIVINNNTSGFLKFTSIQPVLNDTKWILNPEVGVQIEPGGVQ